MTHIQYVSGLEDVQAALAVAWPEVQLRYEECEPETELEEVVITDYEWHGDGMNMTFATDDDRERFERLWYNSLPFRLVVRKVGSSDSTNL